MKKVILWILSFVMFLSTLAFLWIAQEFFEGEAVRWVFYVAAIVFMLVGLLFVRLLEKQKKAENTPEKRYEKAKKDGSLLEGQLKTSFTDFRDIFNEKLLSKGYKSESFQGGVLFYKEDEYDKKTNQTKMFYLPAPSYENSFDGEKERARLQVLQEDIKLFAQNKYLPTEFLWCGVFFRHDEMNEEQKKFYYCFEGLCENQKKGFKQAKDVCVAYCGINRSNLKVYFTSFEVSWNHVISGLNIIDDLELDEED